MKILWDIRNNFSLYFIKIRWILVVAVMLLFAILILVGLRDPSINVFIYYPQKRQNLLSFEKRRIRKGKERSGTVSNLLEELLLGPVDPQMDMLFPGDARLLGTVVADNTLFINLSRESIMQETDSRRGDFSTYHIMLQSMLHSVHHLYPSITMLEVEFDGERYNWIGTYGPVDSGINIDWSVLRR